MKEFMANRKDLADGIQSMGSTTIGILVINNDNFNKYCRICNIYVIIQKYVINKHFHYSMQKYAK